MLKITRPTSNEITSVRNFFISLLKPSFSEFTEEALQVYEQSWQETILKKRLENSKDLLLVASLNSQAIGLVSGTPPEGGVGTIIWLIIHPEHRDKKLGKTLLQQACQHYQDLHCHKIKLTAPTEAAKNFYLKQGMQTEGFHPRHWFGLDFWSLGMEL